MNDGRIGGTSSWRLHPANTRRSYGKTNQRTTESEARNEIRGMFCTHSIIDEAVLMEEEGGLLDRDLGTTLHHRQQTMDS